MRSLRQKLVDCAAGQIIRLRRPTTDASLDGLWSLENDSSEIVNVRRQPHALFNPDLVSDALRNDDATLVPDRDH